MDKPSIISQVKNLGTYEAISAEPRFTGIVKNVYPLTGQISNSRRKVKTLGEGSFGRVNLEEFNEGEVATKYFTNPYNFKDNFNELAVLRYLQGLPNVTQLIRTNLKPSSLAVNILAPSVTNDLEFPVAIMGKAKSSLDDQSLYTSWDDVYSTIVQIIRGYAVLHSQGIAHRDTKPQNMLMTSAGEVWISDYGKSIYTDKRIFVIQDGYTGTYVTSAPELLMMHRLNRVTQVNYLQSDAWAVGMSLYYILTNTWLINSNIPKEILDEMFVRLGYPVQATDGLVYDIFYAYIYSSKFYTRYPVSYYPVQGQGGFTSKKAIVERIMNRTIHKPADLTKLQAVAEVVAGFLTYNPKSRLTMVQALTQLTPASAFVIPPRKSIINDYINTTPIPTHIIDNNYSLVMYGDIYILGIIHLYGPNLAYMLDRAAIYYKIFNTKYVNDDMVFAIRLFAAISLQLAECLFTTEEDIYLDQYPIILKPFTKKQSDTFTKQFLISDIPFLGRTFFDELIQSVQILTKEKLETLGLLNFICHMYSIFPLYVGHLDLLKTRLLDYISDVPAPGKLKTDRYFRKKQKLLDQSTPKAFVADFLTYIRQPIPTAGGSRRKHRKTRKQTHRKKRFSRKH